MNRPTASLLTLLLLGGLASPAGADGHISPSPEGAALYFIGLADGSHVESPLLVRFGLRGMGVAPAGVEAGTTGHHHLLLDLETLPALDQPLPKSEQVLHFGGGQTEAEITLSPGPHTLQLLLGNHLHVPHDPPVMSPKITVIVD